MQKPTVEICPVTDPGSHKMASKIWVFYGLSHELSVAEHSVMNSNDGPAVGPARWIDQDEMKKEIMDWQERKQYDPCYLPYRLLSCTPDQVVWYVPAGMRSMTFEGENKPLSGKMLGVPPLVFAADHENLWVFALDQTTKAPGPKAILHVAPFPNTYNDGRVCLGSMPKFDATPADTAKWTEAFFDSSFTHSTFHKYWTAVSKGEQPPLKSTGVTLKRFIEGAEFDDEDEIRR